MAKFYLAVFLFLICISGCNSNQQGTESDSETPTTPNVVLMFLDDGAFDDFAPFGNPLYPTPHVMALASEGTSYYNFHVPQSICSASRAALMTGCYPGRTKVFGAHGPTARGLETSYATMAEVLKQHGYATACFGKWHIGDQPDTRSHARGFDETAGLMYSNDMWKFHPENPDHWGQWPLQYWENGEVTIESVDQEDQKMLSTWYTEKAVDFINRNTDRPFFLYVPHSMPHVPIFCSDKFVGKSGTGLYGDVMMELDWSVGQINQALKDNGLEEKTVFIFIASDNGPWLSYGDHAGITPYREGKGTTFEGGLRNPCIIKYPGVIPAAAESHKMFASIDILPLVCRLTNSPLPNNAIDGKDIWNYITGKESENPQQYYAFSNGTEFQGVISGNGRWKLHLPHEYRTLMSGGQGGIPGKYTQHHIDTALFDLLHDPIEKGNVISLYPEIARDLTEFADQHIKSYYFE
jgi:arylsulfatase A-like enzyme